MNEIKIEECKGGSVMTERRVGTVTMGVSLITIGGATLYSMFNTNFDFLFVSRLSPVILIFLGLEVLVAYFKNKNGTFKYDFLSGIICFILVFFAVGMVFFTNIFIPYLNEYINHYSL